MRSIFWGENTMAHSAQDLFEDLSTSEADSDEFDLNLSFPQYANSTNSTTYGCEEGKQEQSKKDLEIMKLIEIFTNSQHSPKQGRAIVSRTSSTNDPMPPPKKYVRKNQQHA